MYAGKQWGRDLSCNLLQKNIAVIWLISILLVLLLLISWILLAPLVIQLDTRIPEAGLRWKSIGQVKIWHDGEWWLSMQLLFYRKTIRMDGRKSNPKKNSTVPASGKQPKKRKISHLFTRIVRVITSFRVKEWKLVVDTGDYTRNAKLYPLNFMPYTHEHLFINFNGENYLALQIMNRPWKILYAFLR
jgi:hypothetical protein